MKREGIGMKYEQMRDNLAFPDWKTANHMISHIVDNMFGFYHESTDSSITLHFLPPSAIYLVPLEDQVKFQTLYTLFLKWVFSHEEMEELDEFLHKPITRQTVEVIRYYVERGFRAIEAIYGMPLKQILKGVLGVPPYARMLPPKLQDIYQYDAYRGENNG